MEQLSSLDHLNDEISEMAYSRRYSRAFHQAKHSVSSNIAHLVSPRSGLMHQPSKASLVTDQLSVRSPRSVMQNNSQTIPGNKNNSPTSSMATLKRELKHLSRYLDSGEMQIKTALDQT